MNIAHRQVRSTAASEVKYNAMDRGLQLWVALRHASFVPALAVGIGGTFFAVVATSAKIGMLLPWQLPVNQLASDPQRAQLTLLLGALGGVTVFVLMLWRMGRREVIN